MASFRLQDGSERVIFQAARGPSPVETALRPTPAGRSPMGREFAIFTGLQSARLNPWWSPRSLAKIHVESIPSLSIEPGTSALAGSCQRIWYGGPENRLAYDVVRRLVDPSPAPCYPLPPTLVLYGPHSSGKSMLLQLLHEYLCHRYSAQEIQFPSLAEWTRRTAANRGRSASAADPAALSKGILLLDDLHQLADRPAAQRALISKIDGPVSFCQLIVTCLDAPWSSRLHPRLVSRLSAGLTVRMSSPGPDARRSLVDDYQRRTGISFTPEAVRWLCHNYRGTMSELRQLVADCHHHHASPDAISLSLVRRGADQSGASPALSPKAILAAVCQEFGVLQRDLIGHSRRRTIVTARAVAIHVLRHLTDWSLEAIGNYLGKRDHSTVLNALRRIDSLAEQDPSLRTRINHVLHSAISRINATTRLSVENVKPAVTNRSNRARSTKSHLN